MVTLRAGGWAGTDCVGCGWATDVYLCTAGSSTPTGEEPGSFLHGMIKRISLRIHVFNI